MEEPAAGGLPQWTGVYAAFDDVALAALANRGLVRRGRAEVAAGRVRPVRVGDDAVVAAVGDAPVEVVLPQKILSQLALLSEVERLILRAGRLPGFAREKTGCCGEAEADGHGGGAQDAQPTECGGHGKCLPEGGWEVAALPMR